MKGIKSSDQSFRLEREIKRLDRAIHGQNEMDVLGHAYNACVIAHHLPEHIFYDFSLGGKARDWCASHINLDEKLCVLHDVCTAVKHVTVTSKRSELPLQDVRTSAANTGPWVPGGSQPKWGGRNLMINADLLVPKVGDYEIRDLLDHAQTYWTSKYFELMGAA